MNFVFGKNNEVFANNMRFIDPRTAGGDSFNNDALFYFTSKFMNLALYQAVTDKGLFFNLCHLVDGLRIYEIKENIKIERW